MCCKVSELRCFSRAPLPICFCYHTGPYRSMHFLLPLHPACVISSRQESTLSAPKYSPTTLQLSASINPPISRKWRLVMRPRLKKQVAILIFMTVLHLGHANYWPLRFWGLEKKERRGGWRVRVFCGLGRRAHPHDRRLLSAWCLLLWSSSQRSSIWSKALIPRRVFFLDGIGWGRSIMEFRFEFRFNNETEATHRNALF